jgi:hypothetical protein
MPYNYTMPLTVNRQDGDVLAVVELHGVCCALVHGEDVGYL